MTTTPDVQLKPLAPLARTIAETVRDTPVRLGTPEGAADLVATLTVKIAAYMGGELGPEARILGEIVAERQRQDAKFGEQNHRDGTGPDRVWAFTGPASYVADCARATTDQLAEDGYLSWLDVALEEFAEAAAEEDPAKLRAELVQVAAVAIAWIAAIDRRPA